MSSLLRTHQGPTEHFQQWKGTAAGIQSVMRRIQQARARRQRLLQFHLCPLTV